MYLTLGAEIQSLSARALDDQSYIMMASLDYSTKFDVVDHELLLKCPKIID
jgi:hypothetical protein